MYDQKINFCDLQLPKDMEERIWKKAKSLIARNGYILDDEVDKFENLFAAYCHSSHCIGVSSGCDALLLAMEGLGIGKGDEVITVANTFIGTVLPIIKAGATPVLVDCDPQTQQIDPNQVSAAITSKTSAIVPVHLYGRLAPMDQLIKIADKHGLIILEDAAQAHGAFYKGKKAGSMGTAAGFSFYPAKNLGAWGDAGAMTTSDSDLAKKVEKIRNYGQSKKYSHTLIGWNSRLDSIQSIVLSEKLSLMEHWNEKRTIASEWYYERLKDSNFQTYKDLSENKPVHHLFVITNKNREGLQNKLNSRGIPTGIHYPVPIHKHPCFQDEPFAKGFRFPHSEKQADQLLSLPMHPNLTEDEVDCICTCMLKDEL